MTGSCAARCSTRQLAWVAWRHNGYPALLIVLLDARYRLESSNAA
jgi:hypothetical protein